MEREAIARLLLSELAKPRWEKRFGPSAWELRALLQQQGVALASTELLDLLAAARARGWVRYQSPPAGAPQTTVGNIRITAAGRAWLAQAAEPGPEG
jgi:DNA-binding IclR family transcriptional regulator